MIEIFSRSVKLRLNVTPFVCERRDTYKFNEYCSDSCLANNTDEILKSTRTLRNAKHYFNYFDIKPRTKTNVYRLKYTLFYNEFFFVENLRI